MEEGAPWSLPPTGWGMEERRFQRWFQAQPLSL